MNTPKTIWQKLSTLGVHNQMPLYEVRKRMVFNRINLSILAISLLWLIHFLFLDHMQLVLMALNLVPVFWCFACIALMRNGNFIMATIGSFLLYPPAVMLYALLSHQPVILFYHLLLCGFVFLFVSRKWLTVTINLYVLAWFIAGSFLSWPLNTENGLTMLFVVATAFSIAYLSFQSIKVGVIAYEDSIKEANEHLALAKQQVEEQKEKLERYAASLETKSASLAELNEVKTRLFSILSHDLKGHVYGFHKIITMASEPGMGGAFLEHMLPSLQKDAESTISMLEGILDWSKTLLISAEPVKEPVNVAEMLQTMTELFESMASKKNLFFRTYVQKDLISVADRNMLETVFRNVISNAIKFSKPGHPIVIEAEGNYSTMTINVTDFGVGMQQSQLDSLLHNETFSMRGTFDEAGSGIGLLLSRELLEKNDGALNIISTKGKGTKVQVNLPLHNCAHN